MKQDATIQNDIHSSVNPQIRAKYCTIPTIEQYIQSIPFVQNPSFYYGPDVYDDRQTVKEHFCSFWKRELNLSITERTRLEEIFEHSITVRSYFANNNSYLIFINENSVISIQSMKDAIFDVLDLRQCGK